MVPDGLVPQVSLKTWVLHSLNPTERQSFGVVCPPPSVMNLRQPWKKLDADKLKAEKIKACVRAKVEHPFRYINQAFSYDKGAMTSE